MSDMYVHGNDVEGKPLQEDVITREAASKSVHVLGQGNPCSLMLQHTANLHVIVPCALQLELHHSSCPLHVHQPVNGSLLASIHRIIIYMLRSCTQLPHCMQIAHGRLASI
jgi:hypothetical protein